MINAHNFDKQRHHQENRGTSGVARFTAISKLLVPALRLPSLAGNYGMASARRGTPLPPPFMTKLDSTRHRDKHHRKRKCPCAYPVTCMLNVLVGVTNKIKRAPPPFPRTQQSYLLAGIYNGSRRPPFRGGGWGGFDVSLLQSSSREAILECLRPRLLRRVLAKSRREEGRLPRLRPDYPADGGK